MKNDIVDKVLLEKIGEKIRSIRQSQNLSQESLALKIDIDRSYLGSVERGERNISVVSPHGE